MSCQVRLGPLTSTHWTPDKYVYESLIQGYDMSARRLPIPVVFSFIIQLYSLRERRRVSGKIMAV